MGSWTRPGVEKLASLQKTRRGEDVGGRGLGAKAGLMGERGGGWEEGSGWRKEGEAGNRAT